MITNHSWLIYNHSKHLTKPQKYDWGHSLKWKSQSKSKALCTLEAVALFRMHMHASLYLKQSGPNNILGNSWLFKIWNFPLPIFYMQLGVWEQILELDVFSILENNLKSLLLKNSFHLHSLPQPYSSMYFNSQNSPISIVHDMWKIKFMNLMSRFGKLHWTVFPFLSSAYKILLFENIYNIHYLFFYRGVPSDRIWSDSWSAIQT